MKDKDLSLEIWNVGSRYAEHLGPIPSSFSILIRGLCVDASRNGDNISQYNEAAMLRFLKGPSMLAPFYFILKTFKKEFLTGQKVTLVEIVRQFKALELASFLGLLYTYRQTKKLVADEKEWEIISEHAQLRSEIGAMVGYHLPICEAESGLLTGGMRFLAWASLLAGNSKAYQEYRRFLKKHDMIGDTEFEIKTWGCTVGTIVAHRLISLGFNRELAISIGNGMMLSELPDRFVFPGEYSVKTNEIWTSALITRGTVPDLSEEERFAIDKDQVNLLVDCAQQSCTKGSQYSWLTKGKTDMTPESAEEINFAEVILVNSSSTSKACIDNEESDDDQKIE